MLVEAIDTQTIVYEAVQKETQTTIKWCLKTCCGKRKATVDLLNTVSNKKAVVKSLKIKLLCMIPKFMHCMKSSGNG